MHATEQDVLLSAPVTTLPPDEESFQYEILTPKDEHTSIATELELQEKYLTLTASLIHDLAAEGADVAIFLDKSARPLAWMVQRFWEHFAPQERDPDSGELRTAPMPDIKCVNIDRLDWRLSPGEEIADGGAKPITDDDKAGLRAIFNEDDKEHFAGKRLAIVDEQKESGDTLRVAAELFAAAFPESEQITEHAWITHASEVVNGKVHYKIELKPAWYPKKQNDGLPEDDTGRGVYGPVPYELRSEDFRRRFPPESNKFLGSLAVDDKLALGRLSDGEKLVLLALEAQLAEIGDDADRAAERQEIERKIHDIRFEEEPKGVQLRHEIGRLVVDYLSGRLTPGVVADREVIRGVPADDYYAERRRVVAQRKREADAANAAERSLKAERAREDRAAARRRAT